MRIELIALDLAGAVKAAAGDRSLYATTSNAATIAPLVQMVAAAQAELCRKTKAKAPWVGYLGRDPEANVIVGSCSFKDACRNGDVEIAYFTFPQSEGRGFGARMAAALVEIAMREPEVSRILAHTLPEENASTHILRRLGFSLLGAVEDRDDGTVWRWTLDADLHPNRAGRDS